MLGRLPVCVVTERAAPGGLPRPDKPSLWVLTRPLVGRPEQGGDREAARPALLETREGGPDAVVEGLLDVAGDDGGHRGHRLSSVP